MMSLIFIAIILHQLADKTFHFVQIVHYPVLDTSLAFDVIVRHKSLERTMVSDFFSPQTSCKRKYYAHNGRPAEALSESVREKYFKFKNRPA